MSPAAEQVCTRLCFTPLFVGASRKLRSRARCALCDQFLHSRNGQINTWMLGRAGCEIARSLSQFHIAKHAFDRLADQLAGRGWIVRLAESEVRNPSGVEWLIAAGGQAQHGCAGGQAGRDRSMSGVRDEEICLR